MNLCPLQQFVPSRHASDRQDEISSTLTMSLSNTQHWFTLIRFSGPFVLALVLGLDPWLQKTAGELSKVPSGSTAVGSRAA